MTASAVYLVASPETAVRTTVATTQGLPLSTLGLAANQIAKLEAIQTSPETDWFERQFSRAPDAPDNAVKEGEPDIKDSSYTLPPIPPADVDHGASRSRSWVTKHNPSFLIKRKRCQKTSERRLVSKRIL